MLKKSGFKKILIWGSVCIFVIPNSFKLAKNVIRCYLGCSNK
jgi:hypothetical protein